IITYDLIHTNWFAGNIFNASLWTKSKAHPANFKLSDHFVNQLSKLIHETYGYVLEGIGGYWWIRRADNFIQYMQDPDDQTITRTIVTMTITNFNHLK
ncbi:MAG: hypothetical protein FWF50_02810, partial [Defluviitaleaceae bacterium]|nr:hypothetical protein [Defluviitaleaceae bacterium]